ncbi:hypothetical protein BYT27DRAFT_7182312 [Phlegmacium glaucopus]|nr:hypothetical protein BYT27DRAFT_7182312 [Phlegmacium glaucopus]
MSHMHKLWSWSKTSICITSAGHLISPYTTFRLCLLGQQFDRTSFVEPKGSSSRASCPRTRPS